VTANTFFLFEVFQVVGDALGERLPFLQQGPRGLINSLAQNRVCHPEYLVQSQVTIYFAVGNQMAEFLAITFEHARTLQ
jgi:hypothetical protein